MPDQNIPPNTPAARHAAEKRSWIIKIYCIIAYFDLGIFGLFPNWWAANSLAVATALLYLGVRYLANTYAAAPEADRGDGDDAVELREGVGQSMVCEYMAGGDGEGGGDDAERHEDAERLEDAERFEDAEDSDDDDDGEAEHEEHGEQPEEVEIEEGAAYEIRSTQINIHIHRGGNMYINMIQGGTLHVNVFGEVEGLES